MSLTLALTLTLTLTQVGAVHFVDDEGGGAPAAVYAKKWTAVEAAAAKRLFLSGEQRAEFESAEAEGDGALMAVVTRGQLDQRAVGLKVRAAPTETLTVTPTQRREMKKVFGFCLSLVSV